MQKESDFQKSDEVQNNVKKFVLITSNNAFNRIKGETSIKHEVFDMGGGFFQKAVLGRYWGATYMELLTELPLHLYPLKVGY